MQSGWGRGHILGWGGGKRADHAPQAAHDGCPCRPPSQPRAALSLPLCGHLPGSGRSGGPSAGPASRSSSTTGSNLHCLHDPAQQWGLGRRRPGGPGTEAGAGPGRKQAVQGSSLLHMGGILAGQAGTQRESPEELTSASRVCGRLRSFLQRGRWALTHAGPPWLTGPTREQVGRGMWGGGPACVTADPCRLVDIPIVRSGEGELRGFPAPGTPLLTPLMGAGSLPPLT